MKEGLIASLQILLIIVLIINSVCLGYLARDHISLFLDNFKDKNVETIEECENLSMESTARCLNRYVKKIYKYKPRVDTEDPTLNELIEEGGDCKNWAEFYVSQIRKLGYFAKRPIIITGNDSAHTFAVISSEEGYCILDQKIIKCFNLKKINSSGIINFEILQI